MKSIFIVSSGEGPLKAYTSREAAQTVADALDKEYGKQGWGDFYYVDELELMTEDNTQMKLEPGQVFYNPRVNAVIELDKVSVLSTTATQTWVWATIISEGKTNDVILSQLSDFLEDNFYLGVVND